MSDPGNGKRLSVIDLTASGALVVSHSTGASTFEQVEVTERLVRVGCTATTKRALREIVRRVFGVEV